MTTNIAHPSHRAVHAEETSRAGDDDPQNFVHANRIHIKDGSLFIDSYLAIHPRELDPRNEAQLRRKLQLTYSINNPSFYESPERAAVALNLGQLIPPSLAAQHSRLIAEVTKYNHQVDSGTDADLAKIDHDRHQPFAAIMRDTLENPDKDPVGIDTLKNGLAMYLLMREKLTSLGYIDHLTDYINRTSTPDQVLGELAGKIGISPLQIRDTALKGGVEGVGKLLGLDLAYVADVKQLVEQAAMLGFSHNIVENWHLGRQLLGIGAPLAQKITTGINARITAKIEEYRGKIHHYYDVPVRINAEEKRVAEALYFVEPIQRALMYKLGYEICFTPDIFADDIAKCHNIYGLHRKTANDMRDMRGTYRIYFSGRGDLKNSMRTLVHEVAHNLWPEQFTPDEVKKIDALAAGDRQRFAALNRIMEDKFPEFEKFLKAYQAGNDAEKAAIAQTTKSYFASYGVNIDEGILPHLRDANDFRFLVSHAIDTLSVEGARHARSGYNSPQESFREVLSRFAELKQVELRSEPQLLHFLAPGLDQIWETYYIQHLKRVYQKAGIRNQGSGISKEVTAYATSASMAGSPEILDRSCPPAKPTVTGTPVHVVADGQTCMSAQTPNSVVDKTSIEINPQTLAAMNTLSAMGVHAH